MSYAHTKRRKLIARLKRKHGHTLWREHFLDIQDESRRQRDGQLLGTLEDVMEAWKESIR